MTVLFAERALLPDGWADNTRIEIDTEGRIHSILPNTKADSGAEILSGRVLLPAPGNLHSHAFQRALAGLTEQRGSSPDSFWSWRALMHQFLERLTPEHIEAISALAYTEMLEAGYAAVGEFHYIHHQVGGAFYQNIAELSQRIAAAAEQTGIGLTHLPVLYTQGGCNGQALTGGQLRFKNDLDSFARLVEGAEQAVKFLPADTALGIAPHSLRAVPPDFLCTVTETYRTCPVHIHIAEQVREVDEVLAHYGARPVEWLLANTDIDPRWCLVHATHMTASETENLAASNAIAGLCPITEANLGDGIFDGVRFLQVDGRFGIGSDSNVRISVSEELRTLEYSQRYRERGRNILAKSLETSTGRALYESAVRGGAQALQRRSGMIEVGYWADLLTLDIAGPNFVGRLDNQILDTWIFAADDSIVADVWSAGRRCIKQGRHIHRDQIELAYRMALNELLPK